MDEGSFGRFRDLLPLGEGGMGQVFLARALGPGGFVKPVVLKRMHAALAKVPALVERFLREARVQAQLVCPNVVQVLDFGRMKDTYFLVLEYVHGVDLGMLMRASKEPLPPGVVVRIVLDACRGLEYAHRARDAGGAPRRALAVLAPEQRTALVQHAAEVLGIEPGDVTEGHLIGIGNIQAETTEYRQRVKAQADAVAGRLEAEGAARLAQVQGADESRLNALMNSAGGRAYVAYQAAENIHFDQTLTFHSQGGIPSVLRLRQFAEQFMGQ